MTANKTIIRYLLSAKSYINLSIETIARGNLLAAKESLRHAIYWIHNADRLIIRKHITGCMPKIIRERNKDKVVEEVMKTYKYVHV